MSQSTLPSISSFTCDWTYDVFLSFRGIDTRNNFTGNLYHSLHHQRGIQTFMDDEEIQKGEEITPTLLQAIKQSRIFIAIFSPNYASSTFCLTELVTILECSMLQGRLFLPVFYDVDPSQIRNLTGTYAEAFAKHEVRFGDEKDSKVQKWRDALRQAANVSGWHFKPGFESEYKIIEKIVEEVSVKINRVPLHVATNPIGLESQILEVTSLLGLDSNERVSMVGIYGIGGIGKSTTARAVHNLIADQFEGVCFLDDIRKREINHDLARLQEALLSDILGEKDIKVGDVYRGMSIIKRRLQRKKVLLILDNVDKVQQLQAFVGHGWFGFGSKVIVTTRDKHLLATHGIVKVYEVKQLKSEKALELFSWHAFKNKKIDPCYVDIAKRLVTYCHGLPLALEVIGSHLFGKSLGVWKSSLVKYKGVLRKDIHEILKVSYDDLEEDEKGIFLDIACFFNSYEISYVKELLYLHGFHAEDGIQVLIDKSLMKIDINGCVRMHDLIQSMGREIVRQESTLEPGRRSRLWFSDDIVQVLEENKGTDTVEVIIANLRKGRKVKWCGKAFGPMKNLKILIVRNAQFSNGPQILPNSLKVLDWSGYPSSSLPSKFNPKNLAILNLPESHLKWFQSLKVFEMLSFLDFEGCKFLTKLPSLSRVPYLGALCLDYCINLIRIHDSVGFLGSLVLFSAQGCSRLESLVPYINLPSLETLDLRGCSRLDNFPEVLGLMENIKDVYLDQTDLYQLPFTIGNLVGLQRLYLRGCQRMIQLPSYILPKVEIITTYGCRGFRSSENEEKVSPKVFANAMCVYNEYGKSFLNVYSRNISSNDVIEVSHPWWSQHGYDLSNFEFDLFCSKLELGKLKRSESSVCFWFRKKFPTIALWCLVKPGNHLNNMVLDFKLNVLINGTKQLTSSCQYIFYTHKKTDQFLCCDLQCKMEGVFSDNEWNVVEILCEMEHLMPGDSKRTMAHQEWTTKKILKWSLLYVYPENEEEDYKLFDNPDSPPPTKEIVAHKQILQEYLQIYNSSLAIGERQLRAYIDVTY
ncbi:putative TIR domain, winged helix-turn-helix DNA-binding domain-containing protein [Medicago truncatula]|uniref:Putative TIR domain, winged helix-turn-helix DNA-binding domain-containing protein n=1 Tax=Medicago truncatula TaxID=3880 RepID=A0A396IJX5_MEDTR|nr:disease resistance protein RPV1-like [Medicago truncatula]RHN65892.1 putative TIR domain, winged helix-turn-helix DNA-binding domain-containing protein [Medicago truncatula]